MEKATITPKDGFRFHYALRKNLASKKPPLRSTCTRFDTLNQEDPPRELVEECSAAALVEDLKGRDGAQVVVPLEATEVCSDELTPEEGVSSGVVKSESSPTASVMSAAIRPQTPLVPSSAEAALGEEPRRYPSRARVSASSSLPNDCGKDCMNNSSKKDKSKINKGLAVNSDGVAKFKVEAAESSVSSYAKRRKTDEETSNVAESIQRDNEDSSLQKTVINGTNRSEDVAVSRQKVLEALSQFERIYKKLLQDEELNSKKWAKIDKVALKLFSQQSTVLGSGCSYVGSVPGVEVGDEFNLRVELCIVGLHRPQLNCVDFTDQRGKMVAVSLVHMTQYAKSMSRPDDFVYSSSGDLKLDWNLALKNSLDTQTPVRVIHRCQGHRSSNSRETKARAKTVTYFYRGLYLVKKYWRKKGQDGLYACMFRLRRISGQPELVKEGIQASRGSKVCANLIMEDISAGKEKVPIPVVNTIDSEQPKTFKYITNMINSLHHDSPSRGDFDCIDACSGLDTRGGVVKNDEIPSSNINSIVEATFLINQCGSSCRCLPSCHNTDSENGVKFQLEVFRTESRGWGVRSQDPIPSGSFICTYIGELIDGQVTRRADDKYLFNIKNNHSDETLWKNIGSSTHDFQKGDYRKAGERNFAIDASEYGNVGRFVNHSSTPNIYAQILLSNHGNRSMPNIVLFSAEDILPLQELTYDYSCPINQPAKVCTTYSRLGIYPAEAAGYEKVEVGAPDPQVRCPAMKRKREDECDGGNKASKRDVKDILLHKPVLESSNNPENAATARQKVMESLSLFETLYRKLSQDGGSKTKLNSEESRPDMLAFKLFNQQRTEPKSGTRYVGNVPGVEVGDEFNLRVELCIVGLHHPHRLSVDFMDQMRKLVAISIVHIRHYTDGVGNCSDFVFSSSGDLKLKWNLALKNSLDTSTPVRVIHGFQGYESSNLRATKSKGRIMSYIYGGLYRVEKYWRKKGDDSLYSCMFRLKRIPGQPELVMKGAKSSRSSRACYGHIIEDISEGKEKLSIPVVNMVDNEHPKLFKYITKSVYPLQRTPPPPRGCDCVDKCSDSDNCACAVKNGGEIPFNYSGAIVEAKPLVYECGPSCKCSASCHNRVSQHGIKFHLQVFKTESRGWGVRSRDRIPSGSFVCEYTGVLLDDQVADRKANDEYLFDIGNNYYDETLWEGLNTKIPDLQKGVSSEVEESFAVDASEYGNVGRFINHSCTPNIYAQNLLFDHDNKCMPHVVFFASEDIPPLQELAYDYNYAIDQVRDSNGNIKKKVCCCGTSDCTGWLY